MNHEVCVWGCSSNLVELERKVGGSGRGKQSQRAQKGSEREGLGVLSLDIGPCFWKLGVKE